jgi:hypothetical protein
MRANHVPLLVVLFKRCSASPWTRQLLLPISNQLRAEHKYDTAWHSPTRKPACDINSKLTRFGRRHKNMQSEAN